MDAVENIRHRPPVKIGIGRNHHGGALMTAGAEKVFFLPQDADLIDDHAGLSVRPGDWVILATPSILTARQIIKLREACERDLAFQVIGHAPEKLETDIQISEFRRKKSKVRLTELDGRSGRPRNINYTVEQADAIIRAWHEKPKRKLQDVCRIAESILGVEEGVVKPYWVRDLVKKYVGTAQRDRPEGWRGVRID